MLSLTNIDFFQNHSPITSSNRSLW